MQITEYEFYTYWRNELTSRVVLSSDRRHVIYERYSDVPLQSPFGFDNPTMEQMYRFIESRCMPRQRTQLQEYLDDLGLTEYNPLEIVKITHGVMWEDFLWLKFPGETLTWEDVKLRD